MLKNWILKFFYNIKITNYFYYVNKNNQIILTYHNILPDYLYDNTPHLLVSYKESIFKKHLKILKKRFKITTQLGEPNSCIITFDDGYQNNFHIAHKILKKEGIKAIFFISSSEETYWIDKILYWISYVPSGKYCIFSNILEIENTFQRKNSLNIIMKLLETNYFPQKIIDELNKVFPFKQIKVNKELYNLRFKKLEINQIEEMKKFGHKIGAHSNHHHILSKLSFSELKKEIEIDEKKIGELFNCNFYAYPFGTEYDINDMVINIIKKSKFNFGFLNINHPNFKYNRLLLPRFILPPNEEEDYKIEGLLSGLRYFLKYRKKLPNIKKIINKKNEKKN